MHMACPPSKFITNSRHKNVQSWSFSNMIWKCQPDSHQPQHTSIMHSSLLSQSVPKIFWQTSSNSILEEIFVFDQANFMQFLLAWTNFTRLGLGLVFFSADCSHISIMIPKDPFLTLKQYI
jgi:hypothetical protein